MAVSLVVEPATLRNLTDCISARGHALREEGEEEEKKGGLRSCVQRCDTGSNDFGVCVESACSAGEPDIHRVCWRLAKDIFRVPRTVVLLLRSTACLSD